MQNGHPESLQVSVLPQPSGAKLVVTTTAGRYLGSVQYELSDPAALPALVAVLGQFAAQQSPIQVAPANAVPGIKVQ